MNNYQFIQTLDKEECADYYCWLHDDGKGCVACPFRDNCHETNMKSGILNWLEEEHVEEGGW